MTSSYSQEFFWTPAETVTWLTRVASELGLWMIAWNVGKDARKVEVKDIHPEMFHDLTEDAIQLYLGRSSVPAWRAVQGRHLLDFQRSYAVQLVPAVLTPDRQTLLQGRMAILRPDQYDDPLRAKELVSLFRGLRVSMKKESDSSRVVVQDLAGGETKIWKDMFVGRDIPDGEIMKLKQFAKGEVVFRVRPA